MHFKTIIAVATLIVALIFLPGMFPASPAAAGERAKGQCASNATAYVVSDTYTATTSTKYTLVQASRVNLNGIGAGCVTIAFSTLAMTAASEYMQVVAVIDGTKHCLPSVNQTLISDKPAFETRAINFVCLGVSAGSHVVAIKFKSGNGGQVAISNPTMIVNYTD